MSALGGSSKPKLHIVTPVYNEGDNFPSLYEAVKKDIKIPHELIVVYDFDEDTTVPVAKKYAAKDKTIRLHKNNIGRGPMNALKSGFAAIKEPGPVLVIMADLSDDLTMVGAMYKEYLNGASVVCASRYMKGGKEIGGPLIKRTLSRVAGNSLYYLRRFPIHDATNNFRLYDKKLLDSIKIESTGGFEVALEITVKAFRKRLKIVELPTTWQDRMTGESKFNLRKWLPMYLHWFLYAFHPRDSKTV